MQKDSSRGKAEQDALHLAAVLSQVPSARPVSIIPQGRHVSCTC